MKLQSPSKGKWLFGCGISLLIVSCIVLLGVVQKLVYEPSTNLVLAAICFSILVMVGILSVLQGRKIKKFWRESPYAKQRELDINRFLSEVKKGNLGILKFTGMKPDLIRQREEEVLFMMPNINLIEHTTMVKVSGGGGISIAGFGLSSGVNSERQEGKSVLDNGKLTLTNNRLVFDGDRLTSETMLKDILVITPYSDGIGLKSRARERVQYFVIVKPKQCTARITCEGRGYEEPMNGEWLAAIIEGAIRSGENTEEVGEGEE